MASDYADRTDAVAAFVRDWLADTGVPGASVAVVTSDETVYAKGFGSRDLAENRPATADTVYGVGSVTKSFAALAVLARGATGATSRSTTRSATTRASICGTTATP